VAPALGLGADALLALAESRYKAAPVYEAEGLACVNSLFNDMTVNSFLVWDPSTREAAFFDTGADGQPMLDLAAKQGLKVKQIFITLIHTDHPKFGSWELKLGVEVACGMVDGLKIPA